MQIHAVVSIIHRRLPCVLIGLAIACGGCGETDPPTAATTADSSVEDADTADIAESPDLIPSSEDTAISDATDVDVPSEDPKPIAGENLFGGGGPVAVDIFLPEDALNALMADPYTYLEATVVIDDTMVERTGVRLAGSGDGFRDLTGKAAFDFRFDYFVLGQHFEGLRHLRLRNLIQDPSMMKERLAYQLLRGAQVPAPRSTYVILRVSGEPFGLYLAIDDPTEPEVLESWFEDGTGRAYEAMNGGDLTPGRIADLHLLGTHDPIRDELQPLVRAIDAIDPEQADAVLTGFEASLHLESVLGLLAADQVMVNRDGYVYNRRNYAVYRQPRIGKHALVVRESLRGFDDVERKPFRGKSKLSSLCHEDIPCRLALSDRMESIIARLDTELLGEAVAARHIISTHAALDPRNEYPQEEFTQAVDQVIDFLQRRGAWLSMTLACADPSTVDKDGDGWSGCDDVDCNDDLPDMHPEAPEQCNLRDDDCDGVLDNNPECPQCAPYDAPNGVHYELCFQGLEWPQAHEACLEMGGDLASIPDEETYVMLRDRAYKLLVAEWWIGLNDRDEEGTFVWSDGTTGGYRPWADGEPNDSGGEDCGHFWTAHGGMYNDMPCDRVQPYICQLETP